MDLRVSVVLLFFFLTGGYSLKCYVCRPNSAGFCLITEETCPDKCSVCSSCTSKIKHGSTEITITMKGCASQCQNATAEMPDGPTVSLHCCGTDLCNAADGVYKGSFLLLFSPLPFYFLFQ